MLERRLLHGVSFNGVTPTNTVLTPEQAWSWSYTAIMESVGALLVGSLKTDATTEVDAIAIETEMTAVMDTSLAYSRELLPFTRVTLRVKAPQNSSAYVLLGPPYEVKTDSYPPLYPAEGLGTTTFGRSLGENIEKLFENMTLSLFSNPGFYGAEPAEVGITSR